MNDAGARAPYTYRQDPGVPPFPYDHPLFIFDGVCVLCSTGVRWLMRLDKRELFRFTTTATPLGRALFQHYGLDPNGTYLFVDRGLAFGKSDGYREVLDRLGGAWRLLKIFWLVPRPIRDRLYDVVARNRYRWFGKAAYCARIPDALRSRLL